MQNIENMARGRTVMAMQGSFSDFMGALITIISDLKGALITIISDFMGALITIISDFMGALITITPKFRQQSSQV